MALTREHVVSTAVEILRRYGLADLSMRRLARELDVQPGALYWHVRSKQELLVEVAAALLDAVPSPTPKADPLAAVAAAASGVRAALAPVPDAADVVGLAYAADPASVRPLGELGQLVAATGVPADVQAAVTQLLVHHILGSVALEQNDRLVAAVDGAHQPRDPQVHAAAFELGLAVIVRGLGN